MASLYGKGLWGVGLYSQSQIHAFSGNIAPVVTFSADHELKGSPDLFGNLSPIVTFGAALTVTKLLAGNLLPQITFGGDLRVTDELIGRISPSVIFAGDLGIVSQIEGTISIQVTFSASTLISEPLWELTEPCVADWKETELCNG